MWFNAKHVASQENEYKLCFDYDLFFSFKFYYILSVKL